MRNETEPNEYSSKDFFNKHFVQPKDAEGSKIFKKISFYLLSLTNLSDENKPKKLLFEELIAPSQNEELKKIILQEFWQAFFILRIIA